MLNVDLGSTHYPVYIGYSIASSPTLWQDLIASSQLCIVTDNIVASYYLDVFKSNFLDFSVSEVMLPAGEDQKTIQNWLSILDVLVRDHHNRDTTIIALGGGVIGDIAGFAAACYQRGVNLIHVPTTLLAQVDSAIGGKNGLNYHQIKNTIGTFYQPKGVVIDTSFLISVPDRDYRAALAEVIKYALINSQTFFDYLQKNVNALLKRDAEVLHHVIETCCRIKIAYVEKDEYDKKGHRALLNFGHTFGHALESISAYHFLHGEAVAWGMLRACYLSERLGYLSSARSQQIKHLLGQYGLLIEVDHAFFSAEGLLSRMQNDKKRCQVGLRFVVLHDIGSATCVEAVSPSLIKEILLA